MADEFLQGASLGSRIVGEGFDQYWKQKQFQEMLAQKAEQRQTAQEQKGYERGVAAQEFELKQQEFGMKKDEAASLAAERGSHAKAYEAEAEFYKRRSPGGGGGAGSEKASLSASVNRLKEIEGMGKLAGGLAKLSPPLISEYNQHRKKISDTLGTQYQEYKVPVEEPSWLSRHLPSFLGGTSDDTASANKLPGLE